MGSIVVAFPRREIATNIRNILMRGGIEVSGVCTTGAQALQLIDALDEGIVVCGFKLQDMIYEELWGCLPQGVEMLLIASGDKLSDGVPEGVVALPMPIKVQDLLDTVEMLLQSMYRRRKKRREAAKNRSREQKELIHKAKTLLMERNDMSEAEAHRYLQKSSMDNGTSMLETAQMVLVVMAE